MFYVRILGSSSAMPLHGRHHSAQWVYYNGAQFLIDCGEGTQHQAFRFGHKLHKLQAIFLSHLHADHVAGLGGLLTTLHMQGHQKGLYIWGPVGVRYFIEQQLQGTLSALRYPLFIGEILLRSEMVTLWETSQLVVRAFPLRHGLPTVGYLFQEKRDSFRLNPDLMSSLGLSSEDILHLRSQGFICLQGRVYTLQDLSLPSHPMRSYAYCSDTLYFPEIVDFVSGVTVLYHEATFLTEHQERARQTFHSTAREAALIAQAAGVRRLYIGHFSTRYRNLTPLLLEARSVFPETYLAEEGQTYSIE
ncbi:MAG: ribonuclease Z [Bacteroidia bacterium]|nr:ribonuclease Z [Bacteroidia bacterium]